MQAADKLQKLVTGQPANFWCACAGCKSRIAESISTSHKRDLSSAGELPGELRDAFFHHFMDRDRARVSEQLDLA